MTNSKHTCKKHNTVKTYCKSPIQDKDGYTCFECLEERLIKNSKLTGYNTNQFVKAEHVFIEGQGTFYFTEEIARNENTKTGNEIGLYIEEILHEGTTLYKELNKNVWD